MDATESKRSRWTAVPAALALVVGMGALAAPATAVPGKGTAEIILAQHSKGRTLSGQGVKLLADAPATIADRKLSLPISAVDPGAAASATAEGSFRFKRGKKSLQATGLRFDLATGTLTGKLGDEELAVFKLGATPGVNGTTGAVSLIEGKLRLTAEAATVLEQKLGLQRALRRDGVGMAWLAAKANPLHEATKAVVSGSAEWGMLASWRAYVLGHQGPPPPAPPTNGTIEVSGGATADGPLDNPATTYAFPAAGGSFTKGLYGAPDKLVLNTQGSLKFAKPMHCIAEIKLTDMTLTIDGADSSIVLGDYSYDINKFTGKSCEDLPSVLAPNTEFATLDASAVSPTWSADGKTVTWANVPATLTAAGAVPFSPTYKAGQPLDPVTITVGIG